MMCYSHKTPCQASHRKQYLQGQVYPATRGIHFTLVAAEVNEIIMVTTFLIISLHSPSLNPCVFPAVYSKNG
jgi:hypothetical protein